MERLFPYLLLHVTPRTFPAFPLQVGFVQLELAQLMRSPGNLFGGYTRGTSLLTTRWKSRQLTTNS
jgi:hypothetical protein